MNDNDMFFNDDKLLKLDEDKLLRDFSSKLDGIALEDASWCKIASYGFKVFRALISSPSFSKIDFTVEDIMHAVALQSERCTYIKLAKILKIDPEDLDAVVELAIEFNDLESLTKDNLVDKLKEYKKG